MFKIVIKMNFTNETSTFLVNNFALIALTLSRIPLNVLLPGLIPAAVLIYLNSPLARGHHKL